MLKCLAMTAGVPSPVGGEAASPRRPKQFRSKTLDIPGLVEHGWESLCSKLPSYLLFPESLKAWPIDLLCAGKGTLTVRILTSGSKR